jgi:sugar lactone lactonase YvrE
MKKFSTLVMMGLLTALFALSPGTATVAEAQAFPSLIDLPDGFRPEGIVIGHGPVIYAGSLANGSIYEANLRTGTGQILVPGEEDKVAVGLGYDTRTNRIFVSGGGTGTATIYDAETGDEVMTYQLTDEENTFINDVVVTRDAAYFTDSFQPVYYRLPLLADGRIPDPSAVETIELSGAFSFVPGGFNSNGIVAAPNGQDLIIVHSSLGKLYRVAPLTGVTTEIDLDGETVNSGDGLLLIGHRLYVVQNSLNQIAVVELKFDLTQGEIINVLTDPDFDVPTTIDNLGASLYVVNARFGTTPTPDTTYQIVKVDQ